MTQQLQEILKHADHLSEVWASYFPTMPVAAEYWRVVLDDFTPFTIEKAIKKCAQKRMLANSDPANAGTFTLTQMLTYTQSVCYRVQKVPR